MRLYPGQAISRGFPRFVFQGFSALAVGPLARVEFNWLVPRRRANLLDFVGLGGQRGRGSCYDVVVDGRSTM